MREIAQQQDVLYIIMDLIRAISPYMENAKRMGGSYA